MNSNDAKLMRAIGRELVERITPELRTADARERVAFMKSVLDLLASDLDVQPSLSTEGLRDALEQGIALMPAALSGEAASWRGELDAIARKKDETTTHEAGLLRELAAKIARALGDVPSDPVTSLEQTDIARAKSLISAADSRWLEAFEIARENKSQPAGSSYTAGAAATFTITAGSLTQYLRRTFPLSARIEAKSVAPVPGGRSKRTILIALENSGALPAALVMRQDMYLKANGTTVRDEYQPLKLLSGLGLPVPKPIHFESEPSELGPPFLLVERIDGEVPGNYFGMNFPCPQAFLDLATTLARLHRTAPDQAGISRNAHEGPHGWMGDQIEEFWRRWRTDSIWPSPVVESAYSWARNEVAASAGSTALVHGDCGPHNFLVRDGRLSGLLDWEFLHIGDPAEDLGIARAYAETMMPWRDFMDAYRLAGGDDIAERRIRLATLLHYLKGTVLVAASGRNFAEGVTHDFIKGANSYTGLGRIEMKIAEFLQSADW